MKKITMINSGDESFFTSGKKSKIEVVGSGEHMSLSSSNLSMKKIDRELDRTINKYNREEFVDNIYDFSKKLIKKISRF